MTIVIDTNLWVSYLLGRTLGTLLSLIETSVPPVNVISCSDQRSELEDVLSRQFFVDRISADERRRVIDYLNERSIEPSVAEPITELRDPNDNYLLEVAVAGGAEVIVSGDKDLLELKRFRGIEILTYGAFEQRLAAL